MLLLKTNLNTLPTTDLSVGFYGADMLRKPLTLSDIIVQNKAAELAH